MASGTSSSPMTKVMLISDAPWEIMRTLISPRAVKTLCGDLRSLANIFADQADDGVAPGIFYVGNLFQVGGNGRNCLVGIDGKRDADLGGGDDVDGAMMLVKDIEDGLEESVRAQHSGGDHFYDGDAFFCGNRLEGGFRFRSAAHDQRAFVAGVASELSTSTGMFF